MKESQWKLTEYLKMLLEEKRLPNNFRSDDVFLLVGEDFKVIIDKIQSLSQMAKQLNNLE